MSDLINNVSTALSNFTGDGGAISEMIGLLGNFLNGAVAFLFNLIGGVLGKSF
jgi:hypothetical protein